MVRRIHVEGEIPAAVRDLNIRVVWVDELVIDAMAAAAPAIWAQSGITVSF